MDTNKFRRRDPQIRCESHRRPFTSGRQAGITSHGSAIFIRHDLPRLKCWGGMRGNLTLSKSTIPFIGSRRKDFPRMGEHGAARFSVLSESKPFSYPYQTS